MTLQIKEVIIVELYKGKALEYHKFAAYLLFNNCNTTFESIRFHPRFKSKRALAVTMLRLFIAEHIKNLVYNTKVT